MPIRFILTTAALTLLGAPVLAVAASAASPPATVASQLSGLFMQSCVRFTGNRDGLRGWAMAASLMELPRAGETAFLNGAPGKVFDATNATGKYVVVSQDDGTCSTVAEAADGPVLMNDLEQSLREAGISYTLTPDQQDAQVNVIRHRVYTVSQGNQAWRIRASFLADGSGIAMLTASP